MSVFFFRLGVCCLSKGGGRSLGGRAGGSHGLRWDDGTNFHRKLRFWGKEKNMDQVIQAVTFLAPIWRSPATFRKGHLTIPKRSERIAREVALTSQVQQAAAVAAAQAVSATHEEQAWKARAV